MKTLLFTILLRGWDIIDQQNFHSKIIKMHACTPNMFFDTSNHRKYQKVIQTGVQREPKIHQKSLKIHSGTFQGPSQCICDPIDCKMIPKWYPKTSKWSQNCHLGNLRGLKNQHDPILEYIANRFEFFVCIHWFQSWKSVFQSLPILAVCKSAVNWLPEGPAAGAKP